MQRSETGMAFKITYWKGSAAIGTSPWPGSLPTAQAHARSHFLIQKGQNGATSVTVTDERTGQVVYRYEGTA